MGVLRILRDFGEQTAGYYLYGPQRDFFWKVRGETLDEQYANVTRFAEYMRSWADNPELLVDNFHNLFSVDAIYDPLPLIRNLFSISDSLLLDAAAEGGQAIEVWESQDGESIMEAIVEVGELLAEALL